MQNKGARFLLRVALADRYEARFCTAIVLMFCAILTVNGKKLRRLHKIRVNSDNKRWAQYTWNKSISNS